MPNSLLVKKRIKTFNKKKLQVNIALNYGSKIELINTIKTVNYIFEELPEIIAEESHEDTHKHAIWFRSNKNPEDLQGVSLHSYDFYLSEEHNFTLLDKEISDNIEKGYTEGIGNIKMHIRAIEAEIIFCGFNPKFALQIHTMGGIKRIRLLKRKLLTDEEIEDLSEESSSDICSICLEEIDTSKTKLPCNHEFCNICLHKLCLDSGYNVNTRCPNCREEFDRSIILHTNVQNGQSWDR